MLKYKRKCEKFSFKALVAFSFVNIVLLTSKMMSPNKQNLVIFSYCNKGEIDILGKVIYLERNNSVFKT